MPQVLVIADSLAFHGPKEVHPPSDPRLYPQVLAKELQSLTSQEWTVEVVAGLGWLSRDAWWALTRDPRVWGELVPAADAVVLAVGSMDAMPAAVPTVARESIRYIRPGSLRRRVRSGYLTAAPHIIRASGGRMRQLPQAATDHYLSRIVSGLRFYRPGLPIVLMGPAPHSAPGYPSQRQYQPARRAAAAWAREQTVPMRDIEALVAPELAPAGRSNPDGIHFGWEVHQSVGRALALTVQAALPADAAVDISLTQGRG